jgi:hypothetical protein
VNYIQYAAYKQFYIALHNADALMAVSNCSNELHQYYSFNGLQLNPDKSVVILVGTQATLWLQFVIHEIKVNNVSITLA